ncbi:MAG: hypothetical protein A4E19_06600 [Nitrospira sp. SG-bin1]|nr:MAG: hypothetical protein A4E19_06600 [Nitrospira sp. SG-bin1]
MNLTVDRFDAGTEAMLIRILDAYVEFYKYATWERRKSVDVPEPAQEPLNPDIPKEKTPAMPTGARSSSSRCPGLSDSG